MVRSLAGNLDFWALLGFAAQMVFASRFVVQWIASERRGESTIPISFWYLSLAGSAGLLLYAIVRADPVFILGQSTGAFIYVRNLMLIRRSRRSAPRAASLQDT